jgi:hypothetical protein
VIHIGDKDYYKSLNEKFKGYDAVLYELVAREEANVPQPGAGASSAVGGVQVGMTAVLDLAFQLDYIDYAAKNMVHADMSPEEFAESMKRRKESFVGMFFRMMGRGFAEQARDPTGTSDLEMLSAMFAQDRSFRLKRIMANQFAQLEDGTMPFGGPNGSTILTERNKKALDVLRRQLDAGKKNLAIFYGAAHMPDMERRLIDEFGMQRGESEWLAAWSLVRAESSANKTSK